MDHQKLAGIAADEIERRGWTTGTLALTEEYQDGEEVEIPIADCKVCLLGGLGAAYFGDPERGEDYADAEYANHITKLADLIRPGWDAETVVGQEWNDFRREYQGVPIPKYRRRIIDIGTGIGSYIPDPFEALYTWNDEDVDDADTVLDTLRAIATSTL